MDGSRRTTAKPEGVWLVSFKKATGKPRLSYDEAVEEALYFGWIDSKPNKLDDERTMLYFAPRKPGSGWSGVNKARLERLLAAGLMTPPGLEKVAAAKADGSWTRLDGATRLELPPDPAAALAANSVARENFGAFPPLARRDILEWIAAAKRPETRARRVAKTVRLAAENRCANAWRT